MDAPAEQPARCCIQRGHLGLHWTFSAHVFRRRHRQRGGDQRHYVFGAVINAGTITSGIVVESHAFIDDGGILDSGGVISGGIKVDGSSKIVAVGSTITAIAIEDTPDFLGGIRMPASCRRYRGAFRYSRSPPSPADW